MGTHCSPGIFSIDTWAFCRFAPNEPSGTGWRRDPFGPGSGARRWRARGGRHRGDRSPAAARDWSPGYRLVPGKDLIEVKLVFSCPDEAPPCMTQAAQSIGSAKIIFGNLQPVGTDAFIVTLKLLDAERGVVESWISEQITKAQAAPVGLRAPVQKWFATLTGQAQPGTIKVAGGVVGGAVWIDGAQAGLLGADGLTLAGIAAGPHQIAVSKTGYEKWERTVNLASGATEKVPVQLKAIAGAEGGPPAPESGASAIPAAPEENEPAPESFNQGSRIGAWATLGLGLVAVGLGGYRATR